MRKTLLATSALTVLFGIAFAMPASAQMMCGPGQQAQASTPQAQGGGMCGMMGRQAADDPMADKPAQQQSRSGMCACCRNMAMMGGQHHMPGMQMPQQR